MRVLKVVITSILIGCALVIIPLLVPMLAGYKLVVIETGSMEPILHVGSLCYVKEASIIHENDIVTYFTGEDNDVLVTHRVIGINMDGTYRLKGDNSNMEDKNRVTDENIMGVTKFNVPYMGYLVQFLATVNGKVLTVGFIVVLSLLTELLDILIKRKKVREST